MDKPKLTQNRIILAFAIAVIADIIQFPITAVTVTGIFSIPGEIADLVVDCIVMIATTMLLGFHWVLLPSLFVEVIPGLDLFPTWTGCVAFLVWRRKKQRAQPPPFSPVVDVQEVVVAGAPLSARAAIPPQIPPPISTAAEQRLKSLNDLRDKNLISQAEYEAKRQHVLNDL